MNRAAVFRSRSFLFLACLTAVLPLLVGFRSAVGPAPSPTAGLIYLTREGDTPRSIAMRLHASASEIAKANRLGLFEKLQPDLGLIVPLKANPVAWPGAISNVTFMPSPIVQGQTVAVVISTWKPVTVTAAYENISIFFTGPGQRLLGLVPINPFTTPGRHWLRLKVTSDAGSVDVPVGLDVQAGQFETQHLDLPPDKGDLLDPKLIKYENDRLSATWSTITPQRLWQGNFRYPLSGEWIVTTNFGERRSYNGGPVNTYHEGLDMAWGAGTPVLAPAAGVVALAEPLTVRGNAVILDHGLGLHTGYWHLSAIKVKPGQAVKPGDLLGLMGTTGLSTGSHLHWEARIGYIPVDPEQWLTFPAQLPG